MGIDHHGIEVFCGRLLNEINHPFTEARIIPRDFRPIPRGEHLAVFPVWLRNVHTILKHASPPGRCLKLASQAVWPQLDNVALVLLDRLVQIPFGRMILGVPAGEQASETNGVIGKRHIDG